MQCGAWVCSCWSSRGALVPSTLNQHAPFPSHLPLTPFPTPLLNFPRPLTHPTHPPPASPPPSGRDVVLVEARAVGAGQSGRTSAHVMQWNDDYFGEIEKKV